MIVYKCDSCGREIPTEKRETLSGDIVDVPQVGHLECKEVDARILNSNHKIHLCKSCAKAISAMIDYEMFKFKTEALQGR